MPMENTELTTNDVARLTGLGESTVRKHAAALGGVRKGARRLLFTEDKVREGLAKLRLPNELVSLSAES